MNKEVIYLEPEDDITDILTKLQQAEQKLVVLVPPKKAAILRSAVNIKLIAKASKETKKVAVIVTQDPGIMKLAMGSKLMVAKTLQSRPAVPTEADFAEFSKHLAEDQVINDDGLGTATVGDVLKGLDRKDAEADGEATKAANEKIDSAEKLDEEKPKSKKSTDKNTSKKNKRRKQIIFGALAGVVVIVVLVWALVFAPAVSIVVAIRSTASNFAETVSFTEDPAAENLEEGKLLVQKQTYEEKQSQEFTATGKENRGAKASGKVEVKFSFTPFTYFGEGGYSASIPTGTTFTNGSKQYVATTSASNTWDGETTSLTCDNGSISGASGLRKTCVWTLSVNVQAVEPGEEYNLESSNTWSDYDKASVSNSSAITGGTTDNVTIVSQNDINLARVALEEASSGDEAGKELLYKQFGEDLIVIDASFAKEQGNPVSTPAVGETVGEGVVPKIEMVTTYSVFTVDRVKVEEYIKAKTTLADDQKIYTYGDPYFERFTDINSTARLKTVVETGPIVTEEGIMEKAKGRKIGEVQRLLRSITGVSSVEITPSYFWVNSVPDDADKITIELKTEEGSES